MQLVRTRVPKNVINCAVCPKLCPDSCTVIVNHANLLWWRHCTITTRVHTSNTKTTLLTTSPPPPLYHQQSPHLQHQHHPHPLPQPPSPPEESTPPIQTPSSPPPKPPLPPQKESTPPTTILTCPSYMVYSTFETQESQVQKPQLHKIYASEHVCPASCPGQCEVDCVLASQFAVSSYAICLEQCVKTLVSLVGDGITFYFHGKKDQDFCLVADNTSTSMATSLEEKQKHGQRLTWVQSIGILFDNHKVQISAQKTSSWDDTIDRISVTFDGENIFIPKKRRCQMAIFATSITRIHDTNHIVVEVETSSGSQPKWFQ
ncbi:unnamed protein product [Lactuca virosa]|uniref:Uncharacterized protein n=1 Tax=Lactuca virosa TaxID=75947 RepID=A0AAU9PK25_9ASTR|nr:unnamed protein product [Lactuca virosa]